MAELPDRLSETGLYSDMSSEQLAEGVFAYTPRFELWSDGADKRRWIRLPTDSRIDSRDMDRWIFPRGTQIWKEFTRDGRRIETRLLQRLGRADADWTAVAYVWSADQQEAWAAPYGVIDAGDTPHNVPSASECMACHAGVRERVLGVSAIQLAGEAGAPGLDLGELSARGLLTHAPDDLDLTLPGDETEQAALGYLHANCSHCHNTEPRDASRCYEAPSGLDFRLSVAALGSPEETATYHTVDRVVKPGDPDDSQLIDMLTNRGLFLQMPPLASEKVDERAVRLVRRWVAGL